MNPYTGEVLGTGSARARAFYRTVTNWHRWLAVEGEHRTTARAITGACNAAFLVLARHGPVSLVAAAMDRRSTSLRSRSSGAAARQGPRLQLAQRDRLLVRAGADRPDRDRHGDLVSMGEQSRLHADRKPAAGSRRPRRGPGAEAPAAGAVVDVAADAEAARAGEPRTGGGPAASREADAAPAAAVDRARTAVARAEQQVPTWRTMIVRLPPRAGGPVAFSMSDREHWNSFARSTLTLDGATGAEIGGSRTRGPAAVRSSAGGCGSRIPASSAGWPGEVDRGPRIGGRRVPGLDRDLPGAAAVRRVARAAQQARRPSKRRPPGWRKKARRIPPR